MAVLGVGVVADPDLPVVHADDLGLTRGDGCFEATRLVIDPDGAARVDHLDEHVERLHRSAGALGIPVKQKAGKQTRKETGNRKKRKRNRKQEKTGKETGNRKQTGKETGNRKQEKTKQKKKKQESKQEKKQKTGKS